MAAPDNGMSEELARSRALLMERAPASRRRYEARQARLAREQAERDEQAAEATAAMSSQDAVAAAIARAKAKRAGPPGSSS